MIACGQGRMEDFNIGDANTHKKHKICNLCKKCNVNFNLGAMDLYNLKILVANTTIKLEFFENLWVAIRKAKYTKI